MSGTRNGTGREAGSSQVEELASNAGVSPSRRWQKGCLMVPLGYRLGNKTSRTQLWLGVEDGTWLARGGYGLWCE